MENVKNNPLSGVADELGGAKPTPAKVVKHIVTRQGKNAAGKPVNIHTHVHEHSAHPDEEHVTEGNDALANHMKKHIGDPGADADQDAADPAAKPDTSDPDATTPGVSPVIPAGGTGAASNSPTSATRNSGAATGGAVTITMSPSSTSTGTTTGAGAGANKGGNGQDKGDGKSEKPPQNVNITVDARGMSGHAAS